MVTAAPRRVNFKSCALVRRATGRTVPRLRGRRYARRSGCRRCRRLRTASIPGPSRRDGPHLRDEERPHGTSRRSTTAGFSAVRDSALKKGCGPPSTAVSPPLFQEWSISSAANQPIDLDFHSSRAVRVVVLFVRAYRRSASTHRDRRSEHPPPGRAAGSDHGGHAGHGDHVGMFRRLFWFVLVRAVPVIVQLPASLTPWQRDQGQARDGVSNILSTRPNRLVHVATVFLLVESAG